MEPLLCRADALRLLKTGRFVKVALDHALGNDVLRVRENIECLAEFNHFPFMHNHDLIGDVFDDPNVLGYVNERYPHLFLQLEKQVDDLRAHRHIQTIERFIGYDN